MTDSRLCGEQMLSTFITYSSMSTLHYNCIRLAIKANTTILLCQADTHSSNRILPYLPLFVNILILSLFNLLIPKILAHKSLISILLHFLTLLIGTVVPFRAIVVFKILLIFVLNLLILVRVLELKEILLLDNLWLFILVLCHFRTHF